MEDLVTVDSGERLRELIGEVGERARRKVRPRLDADDRRWLQAASLCFVATSDSQGRCDASPKGDPAGSLVHILERAQVSSHSAVLSGAALPPTTAAQGSVGLSSAERSRRSCSTRKTRTSSGSEKR